MERIMVGGELLHIKKGIFGWNVVYPIKNLDRSINWFNLRVGGNWLRFVLLALVIILIIFMFYEYTNNINFLLSCFDDPAKLEICKKAFGSPSLTLNFSAP